MLHITVYTMSTNINGNEDEYKTIIAGIFVFAIMFLILWRSSASFSFSQDDETKHENQVVNVSNSTVKPQQKQQQQQIKFSSTCQCPSSPTQVVVGGIDKASLIGQAHHESNSTYSFADCQSNAAEMIDLLQDEHLFKYSQAITRNGIGGTPPKQLYYTWDQQTRMCNFYTECGGMSECDSQHMATGMVVPTQ